VENETKLKAFKERLQHKADKPSAVSRLRDIFLALSGPISLVVSLVTVFFTSFIVTDDVKVIIPASSAPVIVSKYGPFSVGPLNAIFLNGGNRAAVITKVAATAVMRNADSPDQDDCQWNNSTTLKVARPFVIKPVVIKSGEVSAVALEPLAEEKQADEKDSKIFELDNKQKIAICLTFELATPGKGKQTYDLVLTEHAAMNSDLAWPQTIPDQGPITLYKARNTLLFNWLGF
jgi:hypothetical protein